MQTHTSDMLVVWIQIVCVAVCRWILNRFQIEGGFVKANFGCVQVHDIGTWDLAYIRSLTLRGLFVFSLPTTVTMCTYVISDVLKSTTNKLAE